MSSWNWYPLAELVADEPHALTDGPFGSKLKSEHYTNSGVRVVRLGNLGVGEFKNDDRSFVSLDHAADLERHRVFDGDLIIAALAEPVGRCCEVPHYILPAIVKADCIRFRPRPDLNRRFIMHWLNSPDAKKNAEGHSHGVGRLRINMGAIRALRVPVPSRSEQDKVVAAIETHFSRLDAAVASLTRAKANVKRARASVLKAAVEGRLVPTEAALARAEGRDYEPASMLLDRILAERKAAWAAGGARGKYEEPVKPETEGLPELPEGWCWTTLGYAFAVEVGATPSRQRLDYWGGNIAWVSSGEVQFCRIKTTRETITIAGLENTSTRVHPIGTVLLGMIGQGRTRGQVAILDIEACNNQNCAAIRVSESGCSPEYVYGWLELQYDQTRRLGGGNNQQALNKARVEAIPLPLPPVAEQTRIVAEVDRRLSVLDALDATLNANLARCARLRQSILKRAFEGRLVPPEPPAAVAHEPSQQSLFSTAASPRTT